MNPKDLKPKDHIIFTFSDGREIGGQILMTTPIYRVEWDDGWRGTYNLDDQTFWSKCRKEETE